MVIFPKNELGFACSNFPNREYNQGTTVKDINNESIVAIATQPTCKGENKGNKDDVSGRRADKPKSHKEKNKKKCK